MLGCSHTGEISDDALSEARAFILPGPRNKFTQSEVKLTTRVGEGEGRLVELDAIRGLVSQGGALLVLLGEGGENASETNINFLLEEYGVMVNSGGSSSHCSLLFLSPN